MIGFLSQDSYTNRFSRVLHGDIMLLSSRYPLVVECRQCLAFETSELPGELLELLDLAKFSILLDSNGC